MTEQRTDGELRKALAAKAEPSDELMQIVRDRIMHIRSKRMDMQSSGHTDSISDEEWGEFQRSIPSPAKRPTFRISGNRRGREPGTAESEYNG